MPRSGDQEGCVSQSIRWLAFGLLLAACAATAQTAPDTTLTPEQKTSRYLDSVRHQPSLLLAFLRDLPKGADLHNHLGGAIYAESLINFAAQNGQCVDRVTARLLRTTCDSCEKYTNKPAVKCAFQDQLLYNTMVDAWSMRNWHAAEESGHDHFFGTFDKFFPAFDQHIGDALAEVVAHAAADHLQYVELMHTADDMQAAQLGAKVGWDNNLGKLRDKLMAAGLSDIVSATRKQLDQDEGTMRQLLKCKTPDADPGCSVTLHYLYQVLRGLPKEQVFAQIVLGFELAKVDSRFVGLNLVMPEDAYTPMHDFSLHMQMLGFLHEVSPAVRISLHAGELAPGLVPPEGLRFHIRDSIEKAHAERIGHGVSVMYENEPLELLQDMAKRNVMVEICLTSNDTILGVRGLEHPLPVYVKYGVPVALATDDPGVSRGNMTQEYKRAVETYDLSYADLKRMARASVEHSFLSGKSLWADGKSFHRASACASDGPDTGRFSAPCTALVNDNEKARVEWELECAFAVWERKF
jgi:adenosine deaminase